MTKRPESQETIRASIMSEIRAISCCGAVDDIGIEVNWDRPAGTSNWWVTRIKYRDADFPGADMAASGDEISRVEAVLQAQYFVKSDDGFVLGAR